MTEQEYIKVTNKASLVLANDCLQQVLAGDEYGVSKEDYHAAAELVSTMMTKMFGNLNGAITESE